MPEMSQFEYVAHKGNVCPFCGSRNIESGQYESGDDWTTCTVTCNDCAKEWHDVYKLIGYSD